MRAPLDAGADGVRAGRDTRKDHVDCMVLGCCNDVTTVVLLAVPVH